MSKDPVALLEESLRIYSPTGREARLAKYLSSEMAELGYDGVKIDGGGNVLGTTGRSGPSLLLCGHMDTVPGPLPVRFHNGAMSGRGAADAKSSLCALLVAGSLASESNVRITFAGVTREESDGLGVQTLVRSRAKWEFAVFGEPSGFNRITVGYRGRIGMHLSLRTEGGHAGSPWAHRSAIDEFYSINRRLHSLEREHRAGDHFHSLSITPTLMRAGSYHNVVPEECEATFDVRVPPGTKCAQVEDLIRTALSKDGRSALEVGLEFDEATEAYEADRNSAVVRAFQRAILIRGDTKPVMVRKTGTGDMNTLASSTKAQCVTYGPGESGLSHTEQELVAIDDYLKSIDVIREAIDQLARLSRGNTL